MKMPREWNGVWTRLLAAILLWSVVPGCGSSGVASVGGTSRASLEDALKLETDCIQYRVSVDAKGVETWNADYVYFYLMDGDRPLKDERGQPVGQGLRFSQLQDFMREHPEYGASTLLTCQVSRQVQLVQDGRVLSTSAPETLTGMDLDSLLALAGR